MQMTMLKAEIEATSIIDQAQLFSLVPLNEVFLMNSLEAIWQLQPVIPNYNTEDGRTFILPPSGLMRDTYFGHPVFLSSHLLNAF